MSSAGVSTSTADRSAGGLERASVSCDLRRYVIALLAGALAPEPARPLTSAIAALAALLGRLLLRS